MAYTFTGSLSLSTTYQYNVVVIQTKLQNQYGYNLGSAGIDGIYGQYTKNAVSKFQEAHGMTVTGIVDLITWNMILYGTTVFYDSKAIESNLGIKDVTGTNGARSNLVSGGNIFSNVEISDVVSSDMVSYVLKLGHPSSGKSAINSLDGPLWMPLPVIPEQVSESVSASWEATTIPGRASSYYTYTGTSNRTITFSIQLHNDLLEMYKWKEDGISYGDAESKGYTMNRIIKFLESCCYPVYQASKIIPPLVILKIGDEIKMRGFFNNIQKTAQLPFRDVVAEGKRYKKYLFTTLSVSFTEVPASNPNAGSIYNCGNNTPNISLLNVSASNYEDT